MIRSFKEAYDEAKTYGNRLAIIAAGIKCDNPECGWKDLTIPMEKWDEYLDKECPCCGNNLMTKECYDKSLDLVRFYLKMNKLMAKHMPKKEMSIHTSFDENGPKNIDIY